MAKLSDIQAKTDTVRRMPVSYLEALHLAAKLAPYIREDERAGAPLKIIVEGQAFYLALPKNRKLMKERWLTVDSGERVTHRETVERMMLARYGAEVHVVKERRRPTHYLCACGKIFVVANRRGPPIRKCDSCVAKATTCACGAKLHKTAGAPSSVLARNGSPARCRSCAARIRGPRKGVISDQGKKALSQRMSAYMATVSPADKAARARVARAYRWRAAAASGRQAKAEE